MMDAAGVAAAFDVPVHMVIPVSTEVLEDSFTLDLFGHMRRELLMTITAQQFGELDNGMVIRDIAALAEVGGPMQWDAPIFEDDDEDEW